MRFAVTLIAVALFAAETQAAGRILGRRHQSATPHQNAYASPSGPMSVVPEPEDALDAVNALRASRGFRPYLRDEGLLAGARAAARFRAERRIWGHTNNDFGFLPLGTSAAAAGCAANEMSWGFMACAIYENHTYAGAAWVEVNGYLYCHLFVR